MRRIRRIARFAYYMTEQVSANAEVLLRVCRAVQRPTSKRPCDKVAAEFFKDSQTAILFP
jgi:hypothetical protein